MVLQFQRKFENDYGQSLSPIEWEKAYILTYKASMFRYMQKKTTKPQICCIKFFHELQKIGWCWTSDRVKYFPIQWDSTEIQTMWKKVSALQLAAYRATQSQN